MEQKNESRKVGKRTRGYNIEKFNQNEQSIYAVFSK